MKHKSSKFKAQSSREVPGGNGQASNGHLPGASVWKSVWKDLGSHSPLLLHENSPQSPAPHPWDLVERVTAFGERLVRFCKKIPRGPTNDRLIDQLVGAGTSVGANYCEANEAVSKKDFQNTVSRCVKEAKETKFFLRMVVASEPGLAPDARELYREAHELLLIFGSMRHK